MTLRELQTAVRRGWALLNKSRTSVVRVGGGVFGCSQSNHDISPISISKNDLLGSSVEKVVHWSVGYCGLGNGI